MPNSEKDGNLKAKEKTLWPKNHKVYSEVADSKTFKSIIKMKLSKYWILWLPSG